MCKQIGIKNYDVNLPEDVSEIKIINEIAKMNKNPDIHGILVQLPLPPHIDEEIVLSSVDIKKDVDGFNTKYADY